MSYSKKLEGSIKILQQRIAFLEEDVEQTNQKYFKVVGQNSRLYEVNEKLNLALKKLKDKMTRL